MMKDRDGEKGKNKEELGHFSLTHMQSPHHHHPVKKGKTISPLQLKSWGNWSTKSSIWHVDTTILEHVQGRRRRRIGST